jgi:hypothetical protein
MDATRTKRGAWRRSPILPRALTQKGGPTLTATAPWAEVQPEARRIPEPAGVPAAPAAEVPAASDHAVAVPVDEKPVAPDQRLRLGGCLCGAVRYETFGEPKLVELCHCADCRKASGGNAAHYGIWPSSQVQIRGTVAVHAGRSFCPCCGSHVVHVGPHTVTVLLGTLDEAPNDLMPQRELWTIRREPWAAPVPGAMQFERDPI